MRRACEDRVVVSVALVVLVRGFLDVHGRVDGVTGLLVGKRHQVRQSATFVAVELNCVSAGLARCRCGLASLDGALGVRGIVQFGLVLR